MAQIEPLRAATLGVGGSPFLSAQFALLGLLAATEDIDRAWANDGAWLFASAIVGHVELADCASFDTAHLAWPGSVVASGADDDHASLCVAVSGAETNAAYTSSAQTIAAALTMTNGATPAAASHSAESRGVDHGADDGHGSNDGEAGTT